MSWTTLGEICDVRWGETSITKASYVPSGYLAFSASGPDGYLESYAFDGPAIVLSAIGARCGKTFLAGGRWTAIKNTIVIRPYAPDEVDIHYLNLFLNRPQLWPTDGMAQPFITMAGAQSVPVWLPALSDQQRIAARLSNQLLAVGRARDDSMARAVAIAALRREVVDAAFGDATFAHAPVGELGWLDDGDWILAHDYVPEGVRLLQVGDIGRGMLTIKSNRYVSEGRARELSCTLLQLGDILISRMPDPIGRSCVLPDLGYEAITAVDVTIFRPRANVLDKDFAVLYMNSPTWLHAVADRASGTTRARISRRNLEELLIPLPQLSDQRRIAVQLRQRLAAIDAMATSVHAERGAIDALPAALLRRAFAERKAA